MCLLFVSLVGCLTPRMVEHARSLRATPVAAPRNLARLPKHASSQIAADPDEVNALANTITARLRGWRTAIRHERDAEPETVEVSAEKGYLREFGNIVFHFSLLGLLVAVAVGKLFGYEGNVIVIADGGPGFCSASPGRVRLVPRRQHRRRHVAAPDLHPRQRLSGALPAVGAGHLVRRRHRLPGPATT